MNLFFLSMCDDCFILSEAAGKQLNTKGETKHCRHNCNDACVASDVHKSSSTKNADKDKSIVEETSTSMTTYI